MKKNVAVLVMVLLSFSMLLSACGGGGGGGGGSDNSGGSSSGGGATMVLNNTGSYDICEIYVSPVSQNAWGPNQLSSGQKLAAGASLTLNEAASGTTYDVKWVGCDDAATQTGTTQLTTK